MSKKRKTTEELATELDEFHHYESAKRMRFLQKELDKAQADVAGLTHE